MRFRSIGLRLTLWYAGAFACGLAVLGAAMWFTVRQSLYHAIDESLGDRIEGVRRFIEDHESRLFLDSVVEEFRAHGDLLQVTDSTGRWVYRGDDLPGIDAPDTTQFGTRIENASAGGVPLRIRSQGVEIGGRTYAIQAAAPLHDLHQGLRDSLWVLVPVFPLVLMLASASGWWMSRRALAPVDQITRAARSITAADLSKRLATPKTGDELERLSHTLNEMIARLEAAFHRISRFTADASHELRTPLAVIRTTAEVALRGPQQDGELRQALEQILAELERTSHLVENLLIVAKADSGQAQFHQRSVNLVDAVREASTQAAVLAREKGIDLEVHLPDGRVMVRGDFQALRQLFLILLDNAVKYTAPQGRCEVTVAETATSAIGAVKDTGNGIAAQDLSLIFDRFYRVDPARNREHGAGLGLSIGRTIAEAHGGVIHVASEIGRGSEFKVVLPIAVAELQRTSAGTI